jgi:hypothetical protein
MSAHQIDHRRMIVAVDLRGDSFLRIARRDLIGLRTIEIRDGHAVDVGLRDQIMDCAETHAPAPRPSILMAGRCGRGSQAQRLTDFGRACAWDDVSFPFLSVYDFSRIQLLSTNHFPPVKTELRSGNSQLATRKHVEEPS